MRRRDLALGVAVLASLRVLPVRPLAAQDSGPLLKVAVLSPAIPDDIAEPGHPLQALLRRLAELGYVDGQNLEYEFRFAHHEIERLPALAYVRQDLAIIGRAQGWKPDEWQHIGALCAKVNSWSYPKLPLAGDPGPFEGSPAKG